jgi:gas vesicle protein
MKSSFELAMERFGGPTKKLTEAQKKDIADIESKYKSKIVQAQLSVDDRIKKNPDDAEKIRKQVASEIASLQEKCESEKNKVRGD